MGQLKAFGFNAEGIPVLLLHQLTECCGIADFLDRLLEFVALLGEGRLIASKG